MGVYHGFGRLVAIVLGYMLTYTGELKRAMTLLSRAKTVFVGINILSGGQAMHPTFADVPRESLVEFPVAEDLQMGFCLGLALAGFLPVSVYPRWDFLLLASNQLVNHVDKFQELTGVTPKVIIRTAVGGKHPLNAGPQHTQDYGAAFSLMLKTVDIVELHETRSIVPAYERALASERSTILVEYGERY